MRAINYITNLNLKNQSGGWGGINYRIYSELRKYFDIYLSEGINPKPRLLEKLISKVLRIVKFRGNFFFFSKSRLSEIAGTVDTNINVKAELDFFFGTTPWIHYSSVRPYGTYLDATFRTYLDIYSNPELFSATDVARICEEEGHWLSKAKWIFWGSRWALLEASKQYNFDPTEKKHLVINTGGNVPIPDEPGPVDLSHLKLLFISLNFEKKGGFDCFNAFRILQNEFKSIELTIIGERPPEEVLNHRGVNYAGLLDKNSPEQLNTLVGHLRSANYLVHPTKMDTMGAVIIEAGYFGCPSIAPRMFGIPDLIVDGKTGYLLADVKPEIIADTIRRSALDAAIYQELRKSCFEFYRTNLSWEAIGVKMIKHLQS